MKRTENKSMFGAWMVLFMMSIVMLFSACEKLDEDLTTKSDSKRTTKSTYVQNKNREVTGPTTEVCSWEKVTDVDGQKTTKKYSYTLKRSLKGIEEYRKDVSGFGYEHKSNNPIERGEASEVRTEDGVAKIYGRTDKLSGNKENGFETDKVVMPYDFYHEKLVFDDGEISVTFDFEEIAFSDKVTKVEPITSPVTGKEAARLSNTISTKYIGYAQDASESVVLLMEKGVTIVSHGFVTDECYEVPENGKVTAYFLHRTTKSDGTHVDKKIEVSDTRSSAEKPWSSVEANNNQTTGSATRTQTGSSDKSTTKDDVTVKWKRYSYDLKSPVTLAGSTQNNLIEVEEPEGWTAEYNGDTYTIPRPNYTVSCDKGAVSGGSEVDGYKVYDYLSKFSYNRGNNTKSLNGKGTIKVKPEVRVVSHGFVKDECYEVPENGKVTAYFLHRTTKSDGTHVDKKIEVSDTRSSAEKPWSSVEANNNQTTGSATRTQTGSSDKSTTKDDVTIKWKRYGYDLKSPVTLAGSTQNNLIEVEEPEGWTAEYNGDTYTIPRPNYTVSCDKGAVSGGSEVDGYKVYDYLSKFSYNRGNNTKSLNGKGTIKVKVEETPTFFPSEWGKLKRIKQTVANNPNHNGFVYTWLLEFEEDVKLPVVVAPGSITPDWNFSYAEVTTVSDYNGGTYDKATGKWICTTASDKPNQMVWTRNSKEKANKDYQIARNQNWDEGHTVDGHPSTQTSRYQLTVSSDGRLTAKDTYTGKAMGSWK